MPPLASLQVQERRIPCIALGVDEGLLQLEGLAVHLCRGGEKQKVRKAGAAEESQVLPVRVLLCSGNSCTSSSIFKSNFFALQSFGFLNPDNRADFPSNSNVGRRRTEGGDDQRQDNDMEQGQGALSQGSVAANVVVDQLIKMQEQQTNKVNVRLRNIESAISEIKTKSTKYDRLLEELSKKLQEHDMSITKLNTASVIGSRDEHRNKNGNEPQLPSSKTFSKKQLEVIEATKHSWMAYEKYGLWMKSNQSAKLITHGLILG